jgi:hypothetical protein
MDEAILRRMKEVEQDLLNLDPSVRGEAFAMLRSYILTGQLDGDEALTPESESPSNREVVTPTDLEEFLKRHESEKEHENVLAGAAFWYGQYGRAAFSSSDIQRMADRAGITVPMRIDKTLGQMKRDGRPLFKKMGRKFVPTTHGEKYLKKTYGVRKGVGSPPEEGDNDA